MKIKYKLVDPYDRPAVLSAMANQGEIAATVRSVSILDDAEPGEEPELQITLSLDPLRRPEDWL